MLHSKIASQTQADIRVQGQIDQFFSDFRIGSLLHRCGIKKRHGHGVRSLIQTIFTLPFVGQNFFRQRRRIPGAQRRNLQLAKVDADTGRPTVCHL